MYSDHGASLCASLCPIATVRTLGPEEYRWRLRTTLAIEADASEMIERAQDILSTEGDRLMSRVRPLADRPIHALRDALSLVMGHEGPHRPAG